jgi:hypothetical protein
METTAVVAGVHGGTTQMPDLSQIVAVTDAIILPIIGVGALLLSKVSQGDLARHWERQFLFCLIVLTIVTLRTVIHCDDTWLIRTMTLGGMIIAPLMMPGQDTSMA